MSALAVQPASFQTLFPDLEFANEATRHRVTFAMRDLDRLKCIQAVVDGDLKPIKAADRLGLTTRQIAS